MPFVVLTASNSLWGVSLFRHRVKVSDANADCRKDRHGSSVVIPKQT